MQPLEGFEDLESVSRSARAAVFRAKRTSDGLVVVVKRHATPHPDASDRARFEWEHRLGTSIDAVGVARYLDWVRDGHGHALVIEAIPGRSLALLLGDGPLPLARALGLAASIADALDELHGRAVVHGSLEPSNVIVSTDDRPMLIDLSRAVRLSARGDRALEVPSLSPYAAPEQTGRMNRAVDQRADLYSLGACLYEALTGRRPFDERDPLALAHALLARMPERVDRRSASIPKVLGDIVERLLAKDPDERYRTARGLAHDLRWVADELAKGGSVAPFRLGELDKPRRLVVPQRLYGREPQLGALERAYREASAGKEPIVLVSGHGGIGKSSLADELEPIVLRSGGRFARGRFEPVGRDSPLGAISSALRTLVRQLLAEGTSAAELLASMSLPDEGASLAALVPELARPTEERPALPLGWEAAQGQRLGAVMSLLRGLVSRSRAGVVLVLDDLQWADDAALAVLGALAHESRVPGVLLVCSFREEEVDSVHPLSRTFAKLEASRRKSLPRIALGPLSASAVQMLLEDTLGLPADDTRFLADECVARTGGNPFFLHQLLATLYADGVVSFDVDAGAWRLDRERLSAIEHDPGVVPFLLRQLATLPGPSHALLQAVACFGSTVLIEDLVRVERRPRAEVLAALDPLVAEGLLRQHVDSDELRFLHDRVHQAAWGSVDETKRIAFEWRIGMTMLSELPPAERDRRVAEIAGHLLPGLHELDPESKRGIVVDVLTDAARRAVDAGAFARASDYLVGARRLLESAELSGDTRRAFDALALLVRVKEREFDADGLEQLAIEAESLGFRPSQMIPIYSAWFAALYANHDLAATIRLGRRVLLRYGIDIPADVGMRHVLARVARLRLTVLRAPPTTIEALDPVADPEALAAVEMLRRLVPLAFRLGEELSAVYLAEIALRAPRCGRTGTAGYAWAQVGMLAIEVFDDLDKAEALCTLGAALVDASGRRDLFADMVYRSVLVDPWLRHLEETLEPLDRAWHVALEQGDGFNIASIPATVAFHRAYLGVPLGEIDADIASYMEVLARHGAAASDLLFLRQGLDCLRGRAPRAQNLVGAHFDIGRDLSKQTDQTTRAGITLEALMIAVFMSDWAEARRAVEVGLPERKGDRHIFMRALFPHYAALAVLRTLPSGRARRERDLFDVRRWLSRLETLAVRAPTNVEHRVAHVRAALALAQGRDDEALAGFARAARLAEVNRWPHEAALAHEDAAKLLRDRGDTASMRGHLEDAFYLYERWGATAKLEEMRRSWPEVGLETRAGSASTVVAGEMDLESMMRAAQALSGEIREDALVERLLDIAAENAGATSGWLVRTREAGSTLLAHFEVRGEERVVVRVAQAIEGESSPVPESLVRFGRSLRAPRVFTDVTSDALPDHVLLPGGSAARSLLLVPLVRKDEAVGVLVLVNELAADVFSSSRVRFLEVIAAQAAISLENAELYSNLQASLQGQIELTQANRRFVPQEFLASLGAGSIASVGLGQSVQKSMAVLFSDMRSFTSHVERMTPEQNIAFINEYLAEMEPAIVSHRGFVDSYVGDAIMALFEGGPRDAVAAGVRMLEALRDYDARRRARGERAVEIGIGINSGTLTLGTIGGQERIKCGVIGDCVNLASRVETATKYYRVPLLVGDAAVEALRGSSFLIREVDRVRVRGHRASITLHEVFDADPEPLREAKLATLEDWRAALGLYREGDLFGALELFRRVSAALPDDRVASLRSARCEELTRAPHAPSWSATLDLP
jgi:predicted ATPase/class 3 adenylate cyclase/tRNA A-37 threonylcarbamoyl transferase component Bud32